MLRLEHLSDASGLRFPRPLLYLGEPSPGLHGGALRRAEFALCSRKPRVTPAFVMSSLFIVTELVFDPATSYSNHWRVDYSLMSTLLVKLTIDFPFVMFAHFDGHQTQDQNVQKYIRKGTASVLLSYSKWYSSPICKKDVTVSLPSRLSEPIQEFSARPASSSTNNRSLSSPSLMWIGSLNRDKGISDSGCDIVGKNCR